MAGRYSRDDLYGILGLPSDASPADVTRAYRQQARAWHPDARPADPEAAARFRQLREAYEILSADAASPTPASPPAASAPAPPGPWQRPSWAGPPLRVGPVRVERDAGSPVPGPAPGWGPAPEMLSLLGWLLHDEEWPW
jgi:hypothetical protein